MKISQKNQYEVTFKAIHIADAYNNGRKNLIKIYKLTDKDKYFLNNLQENIVMARLMPDMNTSKLDVWQKIFFLSIKNAGLKCRTGIAAFYNGKPCGLMAYTKKPSSYRLDTICTWPVTPGKKVPFAGTTLISVLFNDFLKSEAHFIDLDAVTNGPFSAVSKYMSLGFKQRGGENGLTAMRAVRDRVTEKMAQINEKVKIIMKLSQKEVELNV